MLKQKISSFELIAILAMMTGTVAFSIDGILPRVSVIASELNPQLLKKGQRALVFFILVMGMGTFFVGPISDAIGRRPVVIIGPCLYIAMSLVAFLSMSLEVFCFHGRSKA